MKKVSLSYLVDDDHVLIMLVKLLIKKHEHFETCKEFYNGKTAFDHLLDSIKNDDPLPDVIFLDINMPVMDGWEFLEALIKLNLPIEIPVYIVTSSIDPSDLIKAKTYSLVKDYIMKPVTMQKLSEIYNELNQLKKN
jgi:CheY-like chemotaxis protein